MKRTVYVGLICIVIVAALLVALLQRQSPNEISIEAGICVHTLTAQDAALVSESGASWVRIDCNASDPNFGNYIKNAKAQNLSVLAILDSWLFNGSCNFTITEWQNKVTYYVSNYADYVDAWEIWNEPANPTPGWTLQNLTLLQGNRIIEENLTRVADFYYSMAQTAYPIIRQYDGDATIVLLGGMNLYSGGEQNVALDKDFAIQLAANGIGQFGDVISLHAYPWTNKATDDFIVDYNDSLSFYRGLFPNRAIWITETGQKLNNSSEAIQAGYLNQAFDFFKGKVDYVFWYAMHDDHFVNGIDYFGLVDDNMQPREAYSAFQDILR